MELLIDDNAYAIQQDYLRETRKPSNLSTKIWVLRMKTINFYFSTLGMRNNEEIFGGNEFVHFITRDLPVTWKA